MHLGQCLEILELQSAESLAEVKKAYKVLVKVWHPDRFSHDRGLKQKAKDKIREINAAYEQLECFFTDQCYKVDPKSLSVDPPGQDPAPETKTIHRSKTVAKTDPPQPPPTDYTGRKTPAVTARTSSLGKYIFWGFLVGLVVLTFLILHFLARMDESYSQISQRALTAIEKKLNESLNPSPAPNQQDPPLGKDSVTTAPVTAGAPKSENRQDAQQCIIYLKNGEYIIAQKWWYNGDMVEYRLKHGIVGIEKTSVLDISCGQP